VLLIAGVVAVIMAITVLGYAKSGQTQVSRSGSPAADGVNVALEVIEIEPELREVTALATIYPTGSYLDDEHGSFATDLQVSSRVLKDAEVFEIDEGEPVGGSYEITIPVTGNAQIYPLDHYDYSYSDAQVPGGTMPAPVLSVDEVLKDGSFRRVPVGVAADKPGGIVGWSQDLRLASDGRTFKIGLTMHRSAAVVTAVAVVIVLVLAMAALSLLVAWGVATGRRPVEATMASWFAAMLFALIPLQHNLPGTPRAGSTWLDFCVFLWVEVALLVGLGVFIISWFRFRSPPDYSDLKRSQEHVEAPPN